MIKPVKTNIANFCSDLELDIAVRGKGGYMEIRSQDVTRPGLHLAGHYEHFTEGCVQVIGNIETGYLNSLSPAERAERCAKFFSKDFPCLIVSQVRPPLELIECAKAAQRPLMLAGQGPTATVRKLAEYLGGLFSPVITMHGALVDVFGVGVLIMGESGIGKSETALELVQRGHRLAADDAVFFKKISGTVVGSAPDLVRYMMEIRGIGIINIWEMYGSGAIKLMQELDMIIQLEEWNDEKNYSRVNDEYVEIHGVEFSKLTVPVKPGRNIAAIIEVAARNFRLKHMGYDAGRELESRRRDEKN